MLCPKCHKEIPDNAIFCDGCGTKIVLNKPEENEVQLPQQNSAAPGFQPVPGQPFNPQQPQQPFNAAQTPGQAFNAQASQQPFNSQNPQPPFVQQNQQFGQQNQQFGQGVPAYGAAQGVLPVRARKKSFDIGAILKNKFVWIGLAAVVLIVVLIIIIANISSSSSSGGLGGIAAEKPFAVFETSNGTYFYKGDKEIYSIDSELAGHIFSIDNSSCVFQTEDDELYIIDGDKEVKLGEGIKSAHAISPDGSTFVFTNEDNELTVYRNGDISKITDIDESGEDYIERAVTSPDGDVVVYSIASYDSDTWEKEINTYIYTGGKAEKLAKDATPLAVSKGGDIIFVSKNDKLGYFKDKDGDEFISVKSSADDFIFSSDYKSLIFYSGSSTYYFDASMEDPVKVCSGSVSLVLADNTTGQVSSLKEFIGTNNGNVCRFSLDGDEFERTKLVSNSYDYVLSNDGSYIYYLKSGKLRRVDTRTGDNDEEFAKAEDDTIIGFIPIQDFSGFYLVGNGGSSLYYVGKSGGTADKPFAEDIEGAVVDDSGVVVYLTDYSGGTGTLYYSSRGEKGKKVEGIGECTDSMYSDSTVREEISDLTGSTVYIYNEDGELYVSTDGKSFAKTKVEK